VCDILYFADKHFLARSHHLVKEILMLSPKKIKNRREMADMSQEQAGNVLGLTRPTYARRELLGKFSNAEVEKLAKTFGCRPLDFKDKPEPHEIQAKERRDAQIESMRETIEALQSENATLRELIDMLKAQLSQAAPPPLRRYQKI
jgi:transcriptional regulator with XRE-family HTH domain